MIETKYYNASVLTDMANHIKNKTGFELTFVEKPLVDGYGDILNDNLVFDLWKQQKQIDGMPEKVLLRVRAGVVKRRVCQRCQPW